MDKALEYLQIIHGAVLTLHDAGITDLVELAKRTAATLMDPSSGSHTFAGRSLQEMARALAANLLIIDHKNLPVDH